MRKETKINITVVLATIMLFFVVFEVALRLVDAPVDKDKSKMIYQASSNPNIIYELKPNIYVEEEVLFRTNDDGFREDKSSAEILASEKEIVVFLGDSVMMARQFNQNETIPAMFEELTGHEVLNFGVDGYSTSQELETLRTKALKFKPRHVFLNYVLNDPLPSPMPMEFFTRKEEGCKIVNLNIEVPCFVKNTVSNVRTLKFFYDSYVRIFKYQRGNDYWSSVHEGSYDPTVFVELRNLSEEHNFTVTIVIYPLLDFEKYKWTWIHELVREDAEAQGLTVIDLYDIYKNYKDADLRRKHRDVVHPNILGHRMAADYIYATSTL